MNLFPWTVFLPEDFENGIIQRFWNGDYMAWGSILLFAGFLEKENYLETLIVIFENVSPKGFFSDWIWRISKFPFWRRILDIYRQPLLSPAFLTPSPTVETPSQQGPKRKRRRIQFVNYLDDHKAHAKQLRKRRHKKFKPYKYSMGEEDED